MTRNRIHRWIVKAEKYSEFEDREKELELRKSTPVKNVQLHVKKDRDQRLAIVHRAISLESTSKSPVMDAIKEFYLANHPEEYEQFEKYQDWHRSPLKRNSVGKWVRRMKQNNSEGNTFDFGQAKSDSNSDDASEIQMIQL